jgi:hypothetical protein
VDRPQLEILVFDAAVSAAAAQTAAELVEALERAFTLLGFDYFRAVEALSDGEARVLRYMMGKVHPEWETLYSEDRLAQQDPRLRRALTSSEPFFLSDVLAASYLQLAVGELVKRLISLGSMKATFCRTVTLITANSRWF